MNNIKSFLLFLVICLLYNLSCSYDKLRETPSLSDSSTETSLDRNLIDSIEFSPESEQNNSIQQEQQIDNYEPEAKNILPEFGKVCDSDSDCGSSEYCTNYNRCFYCLGQIESTVIPQPVRKPKDITSTHTVNLLIKNSTKNDIFVVVDGFNCTPIGVANKSGKLPLRIGRTCGCECPGELLPYPSKFYRLSSGNSYILHWDGRSLKTHFYGDPCEKSSYGYRCLLRVDGALQPVDSGEYNVSIFYVNELPKYCPDEISDIDGEIYCPDVLFYAAISTPPIQNTCGGLEGSIQVTNPVVISNETSSNITFNISK